MSERTGFHGLPAEYATPPGEVESWEAALAYLGMLEGQMVVAIVQDSRQWDLLSPKVKIHLAQQIGFLKIFETLEQHPTLRGFGLRWPDRDQPAGEYWLDERLFEGATLHTNDGDDYFGLTFDMGPVTITLADTNLNMESALNAWMERKGRDGPKG
jgi:hypothetical protein